MSSGAPPVVIAVTQSTNKNSADTYRSTGPVNFDFGIKITGRFCIFKSLKVYSRYLENTSQIDAKGQKD